MMDSQNSNLWNEWANYLLEVVKHHDIDIDKARDVGQKLELAIETLIQTKLEKEEFNRFKSEDYVIFKTQILTKARLAGIVWGAITGVVTAAIIQFVLNL